MDEGDMEAVKQAVADGLREVLEDDDAMATFWAAAFRQLQAQAQQETGRILLGGLGAVLRKGLMFTALGLIVYSLGGWAGLVKVWHAVVSGA